LKFVTYLCAAQPRAGVIAGDAILDLVPTSSRAFDVTADATADAATWCDLRAFIAAGEDAFGKMAARALTWWEGDAPS
jgi:hypothetical protein